MDICPAGLMEGTSLFHVEEETAHYTKHKMPPVCIHMKKQTHIHCFPHRLSQAHHPPRIIFPFFFFFRIRNFILLLLIGMKEENLISPTHSLSLSFPLLPVFFICLPTQSGLILLVTVDIWGPAHSV